MDAQTLDKLKDGDFRCPIIKKALCFTGRDQQMLLALARKKRDEFYHRREVEVRSVIEISNICRQRCNFCNIHYYSKRKKYLIDYRRFMSIVGHIYSRGRRVLLLQSGENNSTNYLKLVEKYILETKRIYNDLKIILCLGSLSNSQYKKLLNAGADRYILKFETSNKKLYAKIKPGDSLNKRIACIRNLQKLGFALGTGTIVGLPGQTINDLAHDLAFMKNFKLSMASASVFIPGEDCVYRNKPPGDIDVTLNFMALMRIMYPWLIIPSTSSLEKRKKNGQYLGLMAGANSVTIHDGTPLELKNNFPIYSVNRMVPDEPFIKTIVKKAGLHLSKRSLLYV